MNKGFTLKLQKGYWVWQTPEEGQNIVSICQEEHAGSSSKIYNNNVSSKKF